MFFFAESEDETVTELDSRGEEGKMVNRYNGYRVVGAVPVMRSDRLML